LELFSKEIPSKMIDYQQLAMLGSQGKIAGALPAPRPADG
jgi:hypothetical protein